MATRRRKKNQTQFRLQSEVIGLALLALSLLTLLAFLPGEGGFSEFWRNLLTTLVGWGRYIIWLFFGIMGFWFIRRYSDEDSQERWEKPVGAVLLLLTLLTLFDFFSPGDDPIATNQHGGGGLVGWIVRRLMVSALDEAGTMIVLFFLFILSIILLSGLSLKELAGHIRNGYYTIQDWRHLRKIPINQSDQLPLPESEGKPSLFNRWLPSRADSGDEPVTINGEIAIDAPTIPTAQTHHQPQKALPANAAALSPESTEIPMAPPAASAGMTADGKHRWHLPMVAELFDDEPEVEISEAEIRDRARKIDETLAGFGVAAKVREIRPGPAVTQFSVEPLSTKDAKGKERKVRVSKIVNLSNDLALALAAAPIRIEAPIPGRPYVGIEVPNMTKATVTLRSAMESAIFQQNNGIMKIALGRNVSGQPVVVDLADMPHMLIAGATGSGKSVCINAVVSSLISTHTPETLRLLMIDPKMVELVAFDGIPHLLAPVVTDLERVVGVLNWATREMDRRYKQLSRIGARNIVAFNEKAAKADEESLPYIVIIIDELADLMMMAPDEVERSIARIAQMARAVGIHLILATQRPSVDVVTGLIKANFPARIAFAVSSQIDSRVILDTPGAERLLGKGDMLYMAPDSAKLQRLQGVWVSEAELERLIKFWGGGTDRPRASIGPASSIPTNLEQKPLWEDFAPEPKTQKPDDAALLEKALEVVKQHKKASISLLQRRLRIGYARAARLIDEMEAQGLIGPDQGGGQAREVLQPESEELPGEPSEE